MRVLVLFIALFAALPASAQQACSDFELVGFTSATYEGRTGVLGFTQACQSEFVDSRMCTSVEVMQTVNLPSGLTGAAWVRPVFVPHQTPSSSYEALDASGTRDSASELSCDGWYYGSTGLLVNAGGQFFESRRCDDLDLNHVACCAAPPGSNMAIVPSFTANRLVLLIVAVSVVGLIAGRLRERLA